MEKFFSACSLFVRSVCAGFIRSGSIRSGSICSGSARVELISSVPPSFILPVPLFSAPLPALVF